ncbi:toxin glutamine deamidase domain-containing protein [Yersinia enterocolitica]|uniref:toxin glutamine deamidase domain-containing protein n=1 Tax=Yersinia enterocolitica TaxID=630 RepID=UPI001CA5E95C|nr:toxin glutamine deamidase domain-containing protein [Yersinia enterocolitica]MBW5835138.1 hypothetical protein [Yersinia enterocolitica]
MTNIINTASQGNIHHNENADPISNSNSNSFGSLHSVDAECEYVDSAIYSLGTLATYTPPTTIENKKDPVGIKPGNYSCFGTKENYLANYLLDRVNSEGKPPLLLRPLAALLALFGIHGFGQTNCASCATAVAETLAKNDVYLAMPKLRGTDVKGIMGLPINSGVSVNEPLTKQQPLKAEDKLLTKLQQLKREDELNGVIVIERPARWQWLPGATQGHACNLIKFKDNNLIHFFDAQKKTHLSFDLSISQQGKPLNSTDQKKLSNQEAQISKFLGPIGAGGIDLYMKEMHEDINRRPEQ